MKMKKILALALAAVLLMAVTVAGTVAYLTDTTAEVSNVFEATGIDIDLKETKNPDGTENANGVTNWQAEMIPGMTYSKNPIVSVVRPTTDVDIWLFVKFEDSNIAALTYDPTLNKEEDGEVVGDNGWTKGDGNTIPENVYYRKVLKADTVECTCTTNPHWHMLDGDTVSIATTVTKATDGTIGGGSLKWTAYAIQVMGANNTEMDAEAAWTALGAN